MPPLQIQRHTETRESSREEPHCDPTDRHNHHLTRPNPTTLPHARAVISISSPSLPSLWTLRHELPPHASQQATDTLTPPQLISAALSQCWCCRCASSSLPLRPVSHFFRSFGPMRVAGECSLRRWRVSRALHLEPSELQLHTHPNHAHRPTPVPSAGPHAPGALFAPHRKADLLSVSRPEPRTLHRVFEPIFRSRYLVYHDPLPLGPISPTEYSYAVTPTTTAASSSNQHTLTLPRSDSLTRTLVGPKRYVRATWRARSEAAPRRRWPRSAKIEDGSRASGWCNK